jgi:hypothetical protein
MSKMALFALIALVLQTSAGLAEIYEYPGDYSQRYDGSEERMPIDQLKAPRRSKPGGGFIIVTAPQSLVDEGGDEEQTSNARRR